MPVGHWRSGLLPDSLEQELDTYTDCYAEPSVVVVDDEADFCELVASYLDDGRTNVVQCTSAQEALDSIAELRPNLAIVDIRLPEMDGFDLVARARKGSPSTVFLMMSAHTSVDLILQAMRRDVHDYLPKPLPSPDDLRKTVMLAMEKQRLQTVNTLQTIVGNLTLTLEGISSVGDTRPLFFRALARGVAQLCPGVGVGVGVCFLDKNEPKSVLEAPSSWSKPLRKSLELHLAAALARSRTLGSNVPVLIPKSVGQSLRSDGLPSLVGVHVRTRKGVEAVLVLASPSAHAIPRESMELCVWFARNAGIVLERHQVNLDLEHHMLVDQLDHLSDAVVVLDKACTKLHYLNIEARGVLDRVGPNAESAALRLLPSLQGKPVAVASSQSAAPPSVTEVTLNIDDQERIFEVRSHPFDTPGRVSYKMFVFHEITSLRREAAKIQELNEELRVQNLHLESMNKELDNFVYIASHDLQEPFRHIDIFAKYLQRDLVDSPILTDDTRFHLDQIMRNSDVACRILADLRTLSRMTRLHGVWRRQSLGQLVREVVDRFSPDLASGTVRIRLRSLPMMKCDAIKMREVFQNLISNGIKYNHSEKKEIEIGSVIHNGQNAIYVKDNGVGIEPDALDYVFEPFKIIPVDGIARGTGLGLYICRKVVEEHEGRIWVESEYGSGSTFYMTFPSLQKAAKTGNGVA